MTNRRIVNSKSSITIDYIQNILAIKSDNDIFVELIETGDIDIIDEILKILKDELK